MADTRHGGFLELMSPDWQPARPGIYGGDRKSLDVHMHMMEALTTFYEMTRHPTHRRRLLEIIDLILTRMLRPDGTGYIQFTMDFEPLPAILFAVSWGRDATPADGVARPLEHDLSRAQRRVRLAAPARGGHPRHAARDLRGAGPQDHAITASGSASTMNMAASMPTPRPTPRPPNTRSSSGSRRRS